MIVIDGFSLLFLPGGIKSYLIALLKALNTNTQAKERKFVILLPRVRANSSAFYQNEVHELEKILDTHISFQYVPITPLLFAYYKMSHATDAFVRRYTLFLWEHYYLPKTVRQLRPTTVLHPYQAVSNYKTSAQKVVVVHDIFHWVENQQYSFLVKYMYNTYKKGCIHADYILTISQTAKKEIIDYLQIDEKKVIVCFEGIDDIFLSFHPAPEDEKEIINYYHLPQKYLFGLVSAREYKNTQGVLDVFKELSKTDSELRLVLVGWPLSSDNAITQFIHQANIEDKVVAIPKIRRQEDLLYLYSLAHIFLFLSYKEGFGLPPLEAIACKTLPVVSNVSALGEIYTGILPTFAPKDYIAVASYIQHVTPEKIQEIIATASEKLLGMYTWEHVLPKYLSYLA